MWSATAASMRATLVSTRILGPGAREGGAEGLRQCRIHLLARVGGRGRRGRVQGRPAFAGGEGIRAVGVRVELERSHRDEAGLMRGERVGERRPPDRRELRMIRRDAQRSFSHAYVRAPREEKPRIPRLVPERMAGGDRREAPPLPGLAPGRVALLQQVGVEGTAREERRGNAAELGGAPSQGRALSGGNAEPRERVEGSFEFLRRVWPHGVEERAEDAILAPTELPGEGIALGHEEREGLLRGGAPVLPHRFQSARRLRALGRREGLVFEDARELGGAGDGGVAERTYRKDPRVAGSSECGVRRGDNPRNEGVGGPAAHAREGVERDVLGWHTRFAGRRVEEQGGRLVGETAGPRGEVTERVDGALSVEGPGHSPREPPFGGRGAGVDLGASTERPGDRRRELHASSRSRRSGVGFGAGDERPRHLVARFGAATAGRAESERAPRGGLPILVGERAVEAGEARGVGNPPERARRAPAREDVVARAHVFRDVAAPALVLGARDGAEVRRCDDGLRVARIGRNLVVAPRAPQRKGGDRQRDRTRGLRHGLPHAVANASMRAAMRSRTRTYRRRRKGSLGLSAGAPETISPSARNAASARSMCQSQVTTTARSMPRRRRRRAE